MTHMWVAVTLISWGIAGVFDKKAVENGTSRATFLAFHLFNVPLVCILMLVLPMIYGPVQLNTNLVLWEGVNALCAMAAMVTYYHALTKTQASWVLGITAGYPVIGQLLSFFALNETFSWLALAAAAVVSFGIAAIGYSGSEDQKTLSRRDKWILYLCVAACTILWGVLGVLDRQGLFYGPPMDGFLVVSIWKVLLVIAVLPFFARGQTLADLSGKRMWCWSTLAAAFVTVGNIGFLLALPLLPTGYVIVATACYPILMYIFALLFLKEKLNLCRVCGLACLVAGLIMAEMARPSV